MDNPNILKELGLCGAVLLYNPKELHKNFLRVDCG